MSIYLSISKIMCSSLFSRGNQVCARIANAKRTTQSRDAALSAVTERACPLKLARWPWQPVRFFENNSEIHDICWGIMNTYFMIFMDITVWILRKTCAKIDALVCPQCVQMTGIFVFPHGRRGHFLLLSVTSFEQNHRFLRVHFEAVILLFWTIWTIYYAT